jgi:hypothetical protein
MRLLSRIKSRVIHSAHVKSIKDKPPVEKALAWLKAYNARKECSLALPWMMFSGQE